MNIPEMLVNQTNAEILNDPYNGAKPVYVSVRNLCKTLSYKPILRNVSFDMYGGEVLGFLGPNGSGKTTTIKVMLGLLGIGSGSVTICGHNVETEFEDALANVGAIIENPELYKYLSGRENLKQFARMYDNIPMSRVDEVIKMVRLEARIGDKVSKYSLGMRQRLGIAQALLHYPKVIILDEPTNGLDPAGTKELRDILRDLAENYGVSVLVSSHQLAELELMCDRVVFLDRGAVKDMKLMSELRDASNNGLYDIVIETTEKDKAVAALSAKGYEVCLCAEGVVVAAPKEAVPGITIVLAQSNISFESISPKKKSLEDAFIEITTNYTSGGVGV